MSVASPFARNVLAEQLVGNDVCLARREGSPAPAINFDHAATTPPLRAVHRAVERFLAIYGSVHRGAGLKSQAASAAYEEARGIVGRFVGARPGQHQVIFTRNTTEALNLLARRLTFAPDQVVITTELEHHANDLPWRAVAPVVHVRSTATGALDVEHYAALLQQYSGRVRLVAVTGASNVTGYMPPIHELAVLAHAHGAAIVVDAAQLAAHRRIDLGDLGDPAHLDYIAISGHKLYAPYGAGALIGRSDAFALGAPMLVGGGSVRRVTSRLVDWADGPARDEAGTPNAVGAIALAAACLALEELGLDWLAAHETALTCYALEQLARVPDLWLYGDPDPAQAATRLGVIPFCLDKRDPHLVAAMLSYEAGIAVRSGSFCAQPYVRRLLARDETGCDVGQLGLVRASFGLATSKHEIDTLVATLHAIARGDFDGLYAYDRENKGYQPHDWNQQNSFSIFERAAPLAA
ncbi:MAG: aminotransferase class V-fold PLP-dependent enzyme [Candidatus Viridilinea halotolerans]|uniref:Aminotransferase class V-fold PLP-dependent enzyme n=1 Tax=Candidatus Viridilinea halotolerans TaxID=2491704 RepID=A0A426TQM6_9CHLR|nr:MAG: aminotransferase class V-fold PLP-dependent enzyme [Candidatus Viridilinea halotolerans]